MGTKMAPTLATLVLGYLELKLYEKISQQYGDDIKMEIEERLKRFLDDIFILLNPSHISVDNFVKLLNDLDERISFSGDSSQSCIPFLDVKIIKKDTKIETDLYRKATDSQMYLNYKSCHPRSTKNNIPYSLARRINCIVSNNQRRLDHLADLKTTLIGRNFPEGVIDKGIEMANKLTVEELRKPKIPKEIDNLAFVSTFCPFSPNIYKTIRDNFDSLKVDGRMKEVLQDVILVHGNRQGPNLKKY